MALWESWRGDRPLAGQRFIYPICAKPASIAGSVR